MNELLSMFQIDSGHPWWHFVVRAAVVYAFLLAAMRIVGNRPLAQMNKFDVILLMVLANTVQNAMNAGDNSVLAGMVLAITLVALNHLLHRVAYRSKHIERAIEGSPKVLVHGGQVVRAVADGASLTDEDIRAELRKAGIADLAGVRWAILETDGHISVIPHHHVAG